MGHGSWGLGWVEQEQDQKRASIPRVHVGGTEAGKSGKAGERERERGGESEREREAEERERRRFVGGLLMHSLLDSRVT